MNGVELAYEVSGRGVPVLLIGGTGMPAVGWQFSQSPALVAAGDQVVTFASRGVAPSEAPPPPYRVADLAADTAALIEHLAIAPCFVVGVCVAGWLRRRGAQPYAPGAGAGLRAHRQRGQADRVRAREVHR